MQKKMEVRAITRYSFRRGSFFPPQVFYSGVLGVGGAIFLYLKGHSDFSILILLIVSFLLIFAYKGTLVHLRKQYIKQYVNLGGILFGNDIAYQELKELYVEKKRMSQTMYSRASSSTVRYEVYQAYAVADQQKYLLTEGRKKEQVMAKLKELSLAAGLPVKDLT